MHVCLRFVLLALTLSVISRGANAEELASFDWDLSHPWWFPTGMAIALELHPPDDIARENGFTIFEDMWLTPQDAGSTFEVSRSSDPDFAGLVGLLVNGIEDRLCVSYTNTLDPDAPSSSEGFSCRAESFALGDSAIVLPGAQIDLIRMKLRWLVFYPTHFEGYYEFEASVTFSFHTLPVQSESVPWSMLKSRWNDAG